MINRKAIGYITANYSSTYGSVLLKDRPIASVPFLGRYRLIDFPLSNMMNAGIKIVGVVMPGNYRSLIDHVGSGKDWGLDRKKGGLFMVPGNAYGTTKGGMRFLLRDIISNKTLFQRSDKPYVVMMGANIIFNMDLNTIIDAHENSGAQMTVVYCKATRNVDDETKLQINENGRLTGVSAGVVYGDNASMDCCIVNRETLLEIIGVGTCGGPGTTCALAMLNDAVKKGGVMASSSVGGLSGAFIPVSEDAGMIAAVEAGALSLEKLEAMPCVCSVGLDMIAIPGDTPVETIAGIIADEMAIGVINNKTTAVRVIPAIGKGVGDCVEYGGLFGRAPIMPVNPNAGTVLAHRGGRFPAPLNSLKN